MSSEGFHSFSESLNKDGAAFTVDTEVEVKTKDGTIYKGKFPYSAFGPKTFKLIIDGTGEEKTFNNADIMIKIIKKSTTPVHYSMRGGKKSRRRRKNKKNTKKRSSWFW